MSSCLFVASLTHHMKSKPRFICRKGDKKLYRNFLFLHNDSAFNLFFSPQRFSWHFRFGLEHFCCLVTATPLWPFVLPSQHHNIHLSWQWALQVIVHQIVLNSRGHFSSWILIPEHLCTAVVLIFYLCSVCLKSGFEILRSWERLKVS